MDEPKPTLAALLAAFLVTVVPSARAQLITCDLHAEGAEGAYCGAIVWLVAEMAKHPEDANTYAAAIQQAERDLSAYKDSLRRLGIIK